MHGVWSWLMRHIEALGEHIARHGWSDPFGNDVVPYRPTDDATGGSAGPEVPVGPQDDLLGDAREVHA